MWRLVFGSVRGTSHVQSGRPCQDYCAGTVIGSGAVAACADGAGSAELSHWDRSRRLNDSWRKRRAPRLKPAPTREVIEAWVDAARARVLQEAESQGTTPRQLACTLLAALVGETWTAFLQIGDGVIVFDGGEGYELAFWPDNGEYANTTRFLTEDDYRKHLRIEIIDRSISELAVLTDGLQMLAPGFRPSPGPRPLLRASVQDGANRPG